MLSAPGLCFRRALTPFHQLDVGPAHPAVGGVLGCTPFFMVFWCLIFIFLCFIMFICIPCVPAFLGSPEWFLCMGDA